MNRSSDHEERRQGDEDIHGWLLCRVQRLWEYIAPHPAIEAHPALSLLGLIAIGLYWVFDTPLVDARVLLSSLTTIGEAIWAWALPAPVQSIFLQYPAIHLFAILSVIGVVIHIRNQGIGHVITDEVVPLVESVSTAIGKTIGLAVGKLAEAAVGNKDVIKDILINVISSWIFWVLVALGIVGTFFSGLLDVLGSLPFP